MGEFKESAKYLYEMEQTEQKKAQALREEAQRLEEEAIDKYYHAKEDAKKVRAAYLEFKSMVKDTCLQYAIEGMMETAIAKASLSERDQNMLHGLVNNYIKEAGGAGNILIASSGKTIVLDTIKEEVKETSEEIIAKADPSDTNTFVIDKKDLEVMMDKLNKNDDFEDVKTAIAVRVVGAEDSFITNCEAEKQKMEEIMTQAEDKAKEVDADPNMDDDVKEEIKQEAANAAKHKIFMMNESPKKAVYDEMVRRLSRSAIKDQRGAFLQENGHIDTERVYTTVKTMYTLIEALNTSKLENVDEVFIESVMKEIEGK